MRTATWKHAERRIAAELGGKRVPVNGRGDTPDIKHERFAIEVKHRKALPTLLKFAMSQAEKGAQGTDKVPLVVLHETGQPYSEAYAVVRLRDVKGLELE